MVTGCFLTVAADRATGGVHEADPAYDAALAPWLAAVLTALVHVSGKLFLGLTCTSVVLSPLVCLLTVMYALVSLYVRLLFNQPCPTEPMLM